MFRKIALCFFASAFIQFPLSEDRPAPLFNVQALSPVPFLFLNPQGILSTAGRRELRDIARTHKRLTARLRSGVLLSILLPGIFAADFPLAAPHIPATYAGVAVHPSQSKDELLIEREVRRSISKVSGIDPAIPIGFFNGPSPNSEDAVMATAFQKVHQSGEDYYQVSLLINSTFWTAKDAAYRLTPAFLHAFSAHEITHLLEGARLLKNMPEITRRVLGLMQRNGMPAIADQASGARFYADVQALAALQHEIKASRQGVDTYRAEVQDLSQALRNDWIVGVLDLYTNAYKERLKQFVDAWGGSVANKKSLRDQLTHLLMSAINGSFENLDEASMHSRNISSAA